ncbi:MAG TPA: hypothetical protein PKH02_06605 [Bacteroidales bacterium]|nr:hypothetical protein [Bacteroidales bacterium]HPT12150.1 hypothetical protein [Bacteroidales bacterium]
MEKSKSGKRWLITVIIIAVGVIAGVVIQRIYFNPSTDDQLEKAASVINKKCPVMIDSDTRLESAATLPGNGFQYNFTLVKMVADSVNITTFNEEMTKLLLKSVKTTPQLKAYRAREVTMSYSYCDKNGKYISTITITPQMYKEE